MEEVLARAAAGGPCVYLDNNATTPPLPAATQEVARVSAAAWGNPSGAYAIGRAALAELDKARAAFARALRAEPQDAVVFTSCGTESNNIALRAVMCRGIRERGRDVLVTTAVEHPSVRKTADSIEGCTHVAAPVDLQGYVDEQAYAALLRKHRGRIAMVSIILAQNEVGTIQPVQRLANLAREIVGPEVVVHTDATQCFGKYYVHPRALEVDMLTASAHKFRGPRGVGLLWARPGLLDPAATPMTGGGQEKGCRSGTENVAAIVGAARALEEALGDVDEWRRRSDATRKARDAMMRILLEGVPGARVNGDPRRGLYNTLSISLPRVHGHAMVELLDKRYRVCVSGGSACSKGKPSEALRAMLGDGDAAKEASHNTLRISLGPQNGAEECEWAAQAIVEAWRELAAAKKV